LNPERVSCVGPDYTNWSSKDYKQNISYTSSSRIAKSTGRSLAFED